MTRSRASLLSVAGLITSLLCACGADDSSKTNGGGAGAAPLTFPTDTSAQGIQAFLQGDPYKEAPWTAETTEPREPGLVSPHGRVIVYYNDVLSASHAAGNGESTPHTSGSMAVKEFYDEQNALLGRAAMLKTDGERRDWLYWCLGPSARCGVTSETETEPLYGTRTTQCGICHGGYIYSLDD